MCGELLLNYNLPSSRVKLLGSASPVQTCTGMGPFFLKGLDVTAPCKKWVICRSERFWQHPQTDTGDITTKGHKQSMVIQDVDLELKI